MHSGRCVLELIECGYVYSLMRLNSMRMWGSDKKTQVLHSPIPKFHIIYHILENRHNKIQLILILI